MVGGFKYGMIKGHLGGQWAVPSTPHDGRGCALGPGGVWDGVEGPGADICFFPVVCWHQTLGPRQLRGERAHGGEGPSLSLLHLYSLPHCIRAIRSLSSGCRTFLGISLIESVCQRCCDLLLITSRDTDYGKGFCMPPLY